MSSKELSYQKKVFNLLQEHSNEKNLIIIPKILVEFTGNRDNASLLSQILYWSDKNKRKDGYFFKTDKEFSEELYMTIYAIRKSRSVLQKMGILDFKLIKAYGSSTIHYKINHEAFIDRFFRFQKNKEFANITAEIKLTQNTIIW